MKGGSHTRKRATPDVRVFLSRPAYPSGGTVVGTIVIEQSQDRSENDEVATSLRSLLESVTVYVAGYCKIDARWHDCSNYTKIYGNTHPQLRPLKEKFDNNLLNQKDDTICFWATNGMEALNLSERSDGRLWKNNETDFQSGLRDDDDEADGEDTSNSGVIEHEHNSETNDDDRINRDILAFTFRVDIPEDLPHSVHATTCRYFYSAHVLVKTAMEQRVLKRDFRVISSTNTPNHNEQQHQTNTTNTRVKFGNCFGLAHSNGLPCHLSVTEIHRPKGQLVVVQNHCLVLQYHRNNDIKTLKVTNTSGQSVCVLTIIGSQSLCPGSCVRLQWDFPNDHTNDWVPCHQVCACLQGEEFAIYEDDSKKRTQSFLFDTCHEWVDPGVTDRVSKTLWLSSSSDGGNGNTSHFEVPCDLKTDVMEVSTWCQVDITVGEQNNNGAKESSGGYQNLSLQIPCRVKIKNSTNDQQEEYERMEEQVQPLNELLRIGTGNIAFPTNDIRSDLKTLSLMMNELVCGEESHIDGR